MSDRAYEDDGPADTIRRYVALSRGLQFAAKRRWWDEHEAQPLLVPEESPVPLVGWPAIEQYWAHTRATLEELETELLDLSVEELAPDLAHASYRQRWRARMPALAVLGAERIAATVRVSAVLRRRPAGWRIVSLVESHVDAVAHARLCYSRRARNDTGSASSAE